MGPSDPCTPVTATLFHVYDNHDIVAICDSTMLLRWGVRFWKNDWDYATIGHFTTRSGKEYWWERVITVHLTSSPPADHGSARSPASPPTR